MHWVELTSGKWRSKVTSWFMSFPWTIGHISLGLVVYLIPNMKNLELFIGLSAVPFMSLWYLLPESPRWLLAKGRYEDAIKVMAMACKWNKMPISALKNLNSAGCGNDDRVERSSVKDLMIYPAVRRNTICIWFCWFACFMGYFGLVYNTPAFDWNIYLVFIFPGILGIPKAMIQPIIVNKVGRKLNLTVSLLLAGSLLLLTALVPKGLPVIILSWIGTLFCSWAIAVVYTYTTELFPTTLRTTALGTASAAARIGTLSSPFVALLGDSNPVLPLIIYGIVVLVAAIFSLWLWPETNKKKMTETLEEAEKVASTHNNWVKYCSANANE